MDNFLNFRKRVIDKEQGAVNDSAMVNYAQDFKRYMLRFFGKFKKFLGMALNWKSLNFGDRKAVVEPMVKYALEFGGVGNVNVEFKENDASNKNTLGSTDGKTINIYNNLLKCDDFNLVVNTTVHEPAHVFQIKNQSTTLSKNTVQNCYYHYVSPYEDFEYYKKNPIEVEAHKIGDTVSQDFTRKLYELYGFKNSYQRAA